MLKTKNNKHGYEGFMTYNFKFMGTEGGGELNRWCAVRIHRRQQTGRRDGVGVFGIEDDRDFRRS